MHSQILLVHEDGKGNEFDADILVSEEETRNDQQSNTLLIALPVGDVTIFIEGDKLKMQYANSLGIASTMILEDFSEKVPVEAGCIHYAEVEDD
jgi:hypothetical protein